MLRSRAPGNPSDLVFKDRKGKKIEEISNAFATAVTDLKLNDGVVDKRMKGTFHTFRHTFASWSVMNGTNLYTVQKLLGHSTLTMTERYSHLGSDTLKEAVAQFDSSLKKTPKGKVISLETAALGVTTA